MKIPFSHFAVKVSLSRRVNKINRCLQKKRQNHIFNLKSWLSLLPSPCLHLIPCLSLTDHSFDQTRAQLISLGFNLNWSQLICSCLELSQSHYCCSLPPLLAPWPSKISPHTLFWSWTRSARVCVTTTSQPLGWLPLHASHILTSQDHWHWHSSSHTGRASSLVPIHWSSLVGLWISRFVALSLVPRLPTCLPLICPFWSSTAWCHPARIHRNPFLSLACASSSKQRLFNNAMGN